MHYLDKINRIKSMVRQKIDTKDICNKLNIKPHTFYNMCNRENITYEKKKKGGRPLESMDKTKRIRRKKIKGGSEFKTISNVLNLNEDTDIDTFLKKALQEANRKITIDDVENYNHIERFKA